MFNLDEAIKHCEEIAMDKTNLAQTLWDSKEKARCKECAEEHNQLAQWLIELKMLKTEQQSSGSEKPNNCEMRDATLEERESIDKYIKSISKPTGVKFGALEQEPSGDLISREAVLENAFKIYTYECGLVEVVGVATIEMLPSVKPQTGHWILSGGYWRCSECKEKALLKLDRATSNCREYVPIKSNYCPHCGAKMLEEQTGSESEG